MSIAESDLKVGDRVVYANQGVCRVVGTTEMEIAGQRQQFIKLSREDDQATVMVPKGRLDKVGLRRIADPAELRNVFTFLAAPVEGPELDWKVRHRTHGERMSEGGLMGLAQVVKSLTTLADLRPLPPKERELYDTARHLLVSEVAAAAGLDEVGAEDAVDLAIFPPGQERKKPAIALALADEEGDDFSLDEGFEGPGLDMAGEEPGLEGGEAAEAEQPQEAKAEPPQGAEPEEAPEEAATAGEEPDEEEPKARSSKKATAKAATTAKAPRATKTKRAETETKPTAKTAKPATKAKPAAKAKPKKK